MNFVRKAEEAGQRGRRGPDFKCWLALAACGWLLVHPAWAQTFTVLYTFSGAEGNACGANPSSLMISTNGEFYGTCLNLGLDGWGAIYQMTPTGLTTPVYSFTDQSPTPDDGANPFAGLTQGTNGLLYGLAESGGTYGSGTIFEVETNGALTSLHSFGQLRAETGSGAAVATNADGALPQSALILNTNNGNFYGTTGQGGTNSYGTVFEVTHQGKVTVFYSFSNSVDGGSPQASLLLYTNGLLYGTAFSGGSNGYGTVFQVTAAGRVTALYSFTNGIDGANPQGALIDGKDGLLYGTCSSGGSNGTGSIFKITTNGVLTPLYSFSAETVSFEGQFNTEGLNPNVLLLGSDGNFYGTTQFGTTSGNGAIYQFTPSGTLNVVHYFSIDNSGGPNDDGANPVSLLQDQDGNFYGTAPHGGTNSYGTIFAVSLPPEITEQPTNQSIALYGDASFSVSATGALGCQWEFDGNPLPGATNETLSIINAQVGQAGSYWAILTNFSGATTSLVVTLSLTNVPVLFLTNVGDLQYAGSQFSAQLTNLTGQGAVVVEASTNLLQWTPIYTNPSGFGGAYFTDPATGNFPVRYYRAITP
jgi:uncharacterized repeat protein (TIGR03803 family)